jgi:hypothetical protein
MEIVKVLVEKYKAKDGMIFSTEEECIFHEKKLDGLIKTCHFCLGTKKVDVYGDGYVFATCNTCDGKGYLERKEVWE